MAIATCEVCAHTMAPWPLGQSMLARCERCGHLTRNLDDAPAHHRDHAYGGDPSLDAARLALTYRSLVADGVPQSVFEVGFGTGSLLRRFLDGGAQISGADPDQLELAVDDEVRRRGRLFASGVEQVSPQDVADLQVDMVYGIHVLEHVVDPLATLQLSARLLRPRGRVHFFTPAGDWEGLGLYRDGWWMLEDPTHVRFFSGDSLHRLAEQAGLRDIEIRRPLLDSLVNDAASAVRRLRPRERPAGVLADRSTTALAAVSAPAVIAARALRPCMRPTLHLVATVGS